MASGTVVAGASNNTEKNGYVVASSASGKAPPTYAEHVAATTQHSVIPYD
jgi:hypothetical protein